MSYVLFHPSRGHMGTECYFVGTFLESDGKPRSTLVPQRAMRFGSAREAYEFAAKLPPLKFWRAGKRLCGGSRI